MRLGFNTCHFLVQCILFINGVLIIWFASISFFFSQRVHDARSFFSWVNGPLTHFMLQSSTNKGYVANYNKVMFLCVCGRVLCIRGARGGIILIGNVWFPFPFFFCEVLSEKSTVRNTSYISGLFFCFLLGGGISYR